MDQKLEISTGKLCEVILVRSKMLASGNNQGFITVSYTPRSYCTDLIDPSTDTLPVVSSL